MQSYYLVTDSTSELSKEAVEELGVKVVPMNYTFDGRELTHAPGGGDITLDEFYEGLDRGVDVSTSQITPGMYFEFFEPLLEEGMDIIYICFSSGLSGTYSNSVAAFNDMRERYPDRKMVTIDSLCASVGEALLVYLAADKMKAGAGFEDLSAFIEEQRKHICHWFLVKDLNQLKKGGRVSPMAAALGTTLGIIPIISIDDKGRLNVRTKIHGLKKALAFLAERFSNESDKDVKTVVIGHGHCPEYAENLKNMLIQNGFDGRVVILQVGPVVGSHVGSGMVAVIFAGEDNKDI